MGRYIARRLLMMVPTLFGITIMSFVIINLAPGGPIQQKINQMRFGGGGGENLATGNTSSEYGVSEEVVESLKKQYGFDKPVLTRYFIWLKNIALLDFGESFTYEEPVTDVIVSKFPVSLQFGIISLIMTYLICIPLGVIKAVKDRTRFDAISSFVLFVLYSIPPLMLGILLIMFVAGESYLGWFPVGELVSDSYDELSFFAKIGDRIHHFVLPLVCYMIGNFTVLTFLMKNSLMDEVMSDYIRTARAKGLPENRVLFKHALRNALIPIVTGLGGFLGVFFSGSIIIEQLFSLDGMGLLGYQSALSRDYNVLMALIFITSVISLVGRLISDLLYVVVDPRIDFS